MFEIGVLAAVMYIVYFIVSVTKFDKNGHVKKSKKDKKKKTKKILKKFMIDYWMKKKFQLSMIMAFSVMIYIFQIIH